MTTLDNESWLMRIATVGAGIAVLSAARAAVLQGAQVQMLGHGTWGKEQWWAWIRAPYLWLVCVPEAQRAALEGSGWECAGLSRPDEWKWSGRGVDEWNEWDDDGGAFTTSSRGGRVVKGGTE